MRSHLVQTIAPVLIALIAFAYTANAQPGRAQRDLTTSPTPTLTYPTGFDPTAVEIAKQHLRDHAADFSLPLEVVESSSRAARAHL